MAARDGSPALDAQAALDAVVHGVAIAVRDGGEVGLAYVNPAFTRLSGYERGELLECGLQLLGGSGRDTSVHQRLRDVILAGEEFASEWLIQRRSGGTLWTRVTACTLAHDSRQVVITLEDISEFKRARESLRASEARLELALATARAAAPCVLWVDEIEKAIGGMGAGQGDSGTGARMLAHILGWMQDMVVGNTMTFTYVPGTGLTVNVNGSNKGTITGADFQRAFFALFIGPNPPNRGLKVGLLGGRCG